MKTLINFVFLIICATCFSQNNIGVNYSLDENQFEKIKVFPNPADNVVNILGVKNTEKATITILDVNGNIRLQHEWTIKNNALNIPISTLENGIYIVHVISPEEQIQTKFFKK